MEDTAISISDDAPQLRRSSRARRKPQSFGSDEAEPVRPGSAGAKPEEKKEPRRNLKRKAAPEVFDLPDDLLDASLGPWQPGELERWPSWIEVESEPAFFQGIINLLGVKQANVEEVYSIDDVSLATLPQPLYGLIFLYQYVEEDSEATDQDTDQVWFANQTTDNACATVAMLNILMNAEGLELGEKLQSFKHQSKDLAPPLRGNLITNSVWIRTAHNSFARRMDLLNAALLLENKVQKAKKQRSQAKPAAAKKKKKLFKLKPSTDAGFHFIAFLPVGKKVWLLDGLEAAPQCIGEWEGSWTDTVRPNIQTRMARYENEQLSFNLLALCGDPEAASRDDVAGAGAGAAQNMGRTKDHTAAIHEWVKKLSDHDGLLMKLHEEL